MAAAYAALVSLMHIIEQLEHHPRPPISLDKSQVQSLTEKVAFFQAFLEGYSINGGREDADALEGRIADAAYAAEDIIESHIVDQIKASHGEQISSTTDLHQGLQKVIKDMDLIKRDVKMEINEDTRIKDQMMRTNYAMSDIGSSKSPYSTRHNNTMVGFDDVKIEIMDKLTDQQPDRRIIPIVGMGGMGKTTLARNIYLDPLIKNHFDFLAWTTISQDYNAQKILIEVLTCLNTSQSRESLSHMSEHELGEKLHKSLIGRKYLIVMDDIWNIEAWDKARLFFPDDNNGSRIIITTRLSNLAFQLTGSYYSPKMNFLEEDESMDLLYDHVFGKKDCPVELEELGKKIAKNCKGLPLSIVVIGGLLAKSEKTPEYWHNIAENLSSIVNLEDDERCLKILQVSYNQLPVHLKPCFLYMGIFPEDKEIRVSNVMKLWIAEGFLKPISGKSLEVVAKEYLSDLVDRNLILVRQWGYTGNIKLCNIHDLLRDLCLRETQKHKFLFVTSQDNLNNLPQRRIFIHQWVKTPDLVDALPSSLLTRSFAYTYSGYLPVFELRLLRVLNGFKDCSHHAYFKSLEDIFQLVNSRYLAVTVFQNNLTFPSSVHLLWNLQTLILLNNPSIVLKFDIWKMVRLRHVKFGKLELPDPQMEGRDDFVVLKNLQTLSEISNFKCSKEVVKRIPNIKKLKLYYVGFDESMQVSCYDCLNNFDRLLNLESLTLTWYDFGAMRGNRSGALQSLSFPLSLKKLTLQGSFIHAEKMMTKLACLPLLEVLKLKSWCYKGTKWETVEGQFCNLKVLVN